MDNKNNLVKIWEIINNLIGNKKKKNFPSFFTNDGTKIEKDEDIANGFNDYFSNIALLVQSSLSHSSNRHFSTYLHESCNNSIFLYPTNEEEVINAVKELKASRSAGFDKISMFLIKQVIHVILKPLVHIIDLSMSSGIVPDKMKIGKIIPVFKKGDRQLFCNYRPITLLPCFSKLLEKVIYNRIVSHLVQNNLLSDNQYGFRSGRSCEHALIDLHNVLLNNY